MLDEPLRERGVDVSGEDGTKKKSPGLRAEDAHDLEHHQAIRAGELASREHGIEVLGDDEAHGPMKSRRRRNADVCTERLREQRALVVVVMDEKHAALKHDDFGCLRGGRAALVSNGRASRRVIEALEGNCRALPL